MFRFTAVRLMQPLRATKPSFVTSTRQTRRISMRRQAIPPEIEQRLDPRELGYTEDYVKRLSLKIEEQVSSLPFAGRQILNRTGIDGMSLGALHAKSWYGLMLFSNTTRAIMANVYDGSRLPKDSGPLTISAGEGAVPPVSSIFNGHKTLLKNPNGEPLIEYNPSLFYPTTYQFASGMFTSEDVIDLVPELKGGQNAKDGIGGLLPAKKNDPVVKFQRAVQMGIEVPSPNQIPSVKSVEELILFKEAQEALTGYTPIIKVSTAYNVVPRALAVVRAGATLNIAGGVDGRTGGTGSALFDVRNNTVIDGFLATRMIREAMDELGLNTQILLSNNIYGHEDLVKALMIADRAQIATLALVLLQNCRYAKTCHSNCPVSITTGEEKFNAEVLIDNVESFFATFRLAAEYAQELGIAHLLQHGRLPFDVLKEIIKPTDDSSYAQYLAYQSDSSGKPIKAERPITKPSSPENIKQGEDEQRVRFEILDGHKQSVQIDGDPGAIGFFASFQREIDKFNDAEIHVKNGGTYFGLANRGLHLYSPEVGDFCGNMQFRGSITAFSALRQFGMGTVGGKLFAAHTTSEVGYRMGRAEMVIETCGDALLHYAGLGKAVILGQGSDYKNEAIISDDDAPLGRDKSIGENPFAALSGAEIYIPRKAFEAQVHTIQDATWKRLEIQECDDDDCVVLTGLIKEYNHNMEILGHSRNLPKSLLEQVKTVGDQALKTEFVKISTKSSINGDYSDTVLPYVLTKKRRYSDLTTTQIKAIKKVATSIVEGHAKKHPYSIKDLDDYGKLVDMYKEDMDLNGSTSFRRFIHQEVQDLIKLKSLTSAQNAKLFAHLLSSSDS